MSSANARRHSSSTMACPPYLIRMTLPWNSLSQGRAPVSTAAFIPSPAGSCRRMIRVLPNRRNVGRVAG